MLIKRLSDSSLLPELELVTASLLRYSTTPFTVQHYRVQNSRYGNANTINQHIGSITVTIQYDVMPHGRRINDIFSVFRFNSWKLALSHSI